MTPMAGTGLQSIEDMSCVLWAPDDIARRVAELGSAISRDFSGDSLAVVGVATGAYMFLADLVRRISLPMQVDFIRISSYGKGTESSGEATVCSDIRMDVKGKQVLIVEDIIDTGVTLSKLVAYFTAKGAASVSVCVFLDKEDRRKVPLKLGAGGRLYTGYKCPDSFVVGYGLDYADQYRGLPYIGVLKPEVYELE